MFRMRATLPLAFVFLLLSCQETLARDCFGSLREPLTKGGYSGGLDCAGFLEIPIRRLGVIAVGAQRFTIYTLFYRTRPTFTGGVPHGGQRILIFTGTGPKTYLGQYWISPDQHLRVDGARLVLVEKVDPLYGTEIRFTEHGPPKEGVIGGEPIELFR